MTSATGLVRDWSFTAAASPWWTRRNAWLAWRLRSARFPAFQVLRAAKPRPRWAVYFAFCSEGLLGVHQRFTLQRLRDEGMPLLVVCASGRPEQVPEELLARAGLAEALIWKALPGYDFSAYRIGVAHLCKESPGADVLVLNDSVWGPLTPVTPWMQRAPWPLTGFTSSATWGNHLQSYGWILKEASPAFLEAVAPVMPPHRCLDRFDDVVLAQELRFASAASRQMGVGSYFHADGTVVTNPTLERPMELLAEGMPFLKRALLGKHAGRVPGQRVRDVLHRYGHPDPEATR